MALSSAQFDSTVLTYRIIKQTITNATPNVDVTSESGRLYEISLVNGSSSNAYFKLTLSDEAVTVGTTLPEMMIRVNAAESKRWYIPGGLAFTRLSFWAVTGPTDNNTTSPTLNSGNGLITTLVVS
tara:strand:+ start:462 stop:839 length:378 start_codon:yes stop_codon:yes gene_type:complete